MNKRLFLVLAVVAMFATNSVMAWGGFGHGAIAYVAEQHLTPEAKQKCRYYLKHTLPYYASWMDHWRGIAKFRKVNNPHSFKTTPDGGDVDWSGNPSGLVLGHYVAAMKELGNGNYKNLPDPVVRQRLINMIHYIPDFHCPVHVGFPKKEFPHYRYSIYKNGKKVKYHGFWDGSPGFTRKNWTFERYAAEVDKVTPKQKKKWVKGSIERWGRDIIKQAHRCYKITPAGTDIAHLTEEQKKQVLELADEQAMKAAYRLAHTLNTIFAE